MSSRLTCLQMEHPTGSNTACVRQRTGPSRASTASADRRLGFPRVLGARAWISGHGIRQHARTLRRGVKQCIPISCHYAENA
ncbi:hypothetical protein LIA77_00077 [Sarocladium implicatum]|nr:hypothetical protein LIA77_00077 [Sarocladium implicatum]